MKFGLLMAGVALLGLVALGLWFFYAPMPRGSAAGATHRLTIGGRQRDFIVVAPPGLKPGAPVLLVLHGSLMNGVQMRRMLGAAFERLAQQYGAVLVYPSGIEGHFNDGRVTASYSARTLNIDDVGFMRTIVDGLAATQQIDRRRVYAFGYSNGGATAIRLATQVPELIAGIMVANANMPTPDNIGWSLAPREAAASTRAVLIEGSRDPINPYEGGRVSIFGFGNRGTVLSALDSARWFAQRTGLGAEPVVDTSQRIAGIDVRQQDWGSPTRVRLVTMQGAGHTVPQQGYRFPRFLGPTVLDDAILDSAWRLLDQP